MSYWRSFGLILLLLTVPTGTQANHCVTDDDATQVGVLYVLSNYYIYLESNGQPGLQRGSENSAVAEIMGWPSDTGGCAHPDTILF